MATSKSNKEKAHKSDSKKETSKTKKDTKSKKDKERKEDEKPKDREGRQSRKEVSKVSKDAEAQARKRKAEDATEPEKKRKKKDKTEKGSKEKTKVKDVEDSVEADGRRIQGGAADLMVNGEHKQQKDSKKDKSDKSEKRSQHEKHSEKHEKKPAESKSKRDRRGPCAAESLDMEVQGRAMPSKSRSPEKIQLKSSPEVEAPAAKESSVKPQSSEHSDSETSGERRRKRREHAGLKAASGFGQIAPPPPAPLGDASGAVMYGPAGPLVPLPEKVKGLLEHQDSLAQEVMRMKMAVEAASGTPAPGMKLESKEDPAETTLKMPTRLTDCLMEPDNLAKLLAKTGLLSATLNQEKHLILRAASRKQLQKTLGQLRRIAWACQWGCSSVKVAALLADKPAKAVNSMVLRLAATSSRLSSHDAKLNAKMRKIRLGTQAGTGMLVLEGIPGLSRKHCTITFEPEKGACYVQDLSTNGTYLNGKRLPRPPFKNPADARVRLFHGDELLFKLRTDDAEELGYVINLVELS